MILGMVNASSQPNFGKSRPAIILDDNKNSPIQVKTIKELAEDIDDTYDHKADSTLIFDFDGLLAKRVVDLSNKKISLITSLNFDQLYNQEFTSFIGALRDALGVDGKRDQEIKGFFNGIRTALNQRSYPIMDEDFKDLLDGLSLDKKILSQMKGMDEKIMQDLKKHKEPQKIVRIAGRGAIKGQIYVAESERKIIESIGGVVGKSVQAVSDLYIISVDAERIKELKGMFSLVNQWSEDQLKLLIQYGDEFLSKLEIDMDEDESISSENGPLQQFKQAVQKNLNIKTDKDADLLIHTYHLLKGIKFNTPLTVHLYYYDGERQELTQYGQMIEEIKALLGDPDFKQKNPEFFKRYALFIEKLLPQMKQTKLFLNMYEPIEKSALNQIKKMSDMLNSGHEKKEQISKDMIELITTGQISIKNYGMNPVLADENAQKILIEGLKAARRQSPNLSYLFSGFRLKTPYTAHVDEAKRIYLAG